MWYENKPWLEYSPEKDSMYCFSCRLFLNEQKYSNKSAWRVAGVNNWKRGLDKMQEHADSEAHLTSMVRWNTYKKNALQAAFEGKAFRGDDESATSSNQGNFLELVKCLASTIVYSGYIWIMSMTRKWKLSDTRWACREKALKALLKVMSTVVKVLTDMTEQEPPDTAAGDAKMYLKAIDFEFFLCLEIATPVFEVTALASDALQNCDIDLSTAYTYVDGVMDTLSNLRTEEQFGKLFKSATEKQKPLGSASPQSPQDSKGRGGCLQSIGKVLMQPQRAIPELKRRFRGDGETESSKILNALHTLTKANNWIGKDAMGPDSLMPFTCFVSSMEERSRS
ncbi:hypothetical protein F7725_017478 [Dissostichus mawsoni]|uniref:TTF-type domain-containing protein n=1 Tax=Dissostichus mawsoni TaxID=36200 RepID=A0A7J5Z4I7_DISMA|nr:hypothetical protein F7725_017478 [Dissostichus mawsoni]